MSAVQTAVEIFCSYAHKDEEWRQKLETHLSLLKRQGLVSLWHDRLIIPGTDWAYTIDTHLETASVILLLVSADFFASDYCYGIEMQHALKRHDTGEARVIPLLVRPVDWKDAPFAHLHALPTDARPLSTWQDEDMALTDVVAGVRRVLEDLSLLVTSTSRATLPAIWNIPYPRNPFFLGRESELVQVRQRLQAGQMTALSQPQAISGLGGIGKTQLALEYAYRYHQDYQAVLWARSESVEALVSSYAAIAALLKLPEKDAQDQSIIVQSVKAWLQTQRGWLLILDNADELTLVAEFLPPTLGGHLLLTTRAQALGRLASRMEVEPFSAEQGALFLLRRAALLAPDAALEQALAEDHVQALQITQEMGGLPLALDQAGAYLEETGCGLGEYLRIYQQHRVDLLKERRGLVMDHPEPVATTWSLSFARLEQRSSAAADLLRFCAFLAPDAIPLEIMTQGAAQLGAVLEPVVTDAFQLNQVIEALRAFSLLRRDPTTNTLSIHRLVQAVVQDAMAEQEQVQWRQRVIRALNAVFPVVTHEVWSQCERLFPHVLLCVPAATDRTSEGELADVLEKAANYRRERAQYEGVEPLYQRALQIWERAVGPKHLQLASPLNNLANLYYEQGKHKEAEPLYQRALKIWEQTVGSEHPDVAPPLNNLANLYYEQGKYEQAEPLYQRALQIRERTLGPEHLKVASPLNNLANLYREQGKYEQAKPLYQRALKIYERTVGIEQLQAAHPLHNLAIIYYEQGKYEDAEPLYQRALRIREQVLGPDHPLVAYSLIGLANLYKDQGKYEKVESLYQRALKICERALGHGHPQMAYALTGLGNLYHVQGKYEKAERMYYQALRIREQALGPDHPQVAYDLTGLGIIYYEQEKYEDAEPLYQRALRIREQAVGPEHPDVATPLIGLALLYYEQEKYEDAEPLYQRALRIREQAVGPEHPDVAYPLNNLATLYKEQGKYAEAEPLYQRALHIWEQQLGPDHPNVASSLTGLATLYKEQSKYAEAEPLYQRALHIWEQQLGPDHPKTAESIHDLARFWEARDNGEEASIWYARALAIREQALGAHHPKTTETRTRFIALLHALGQHEQAAQLEMARSE